MELFLQIACGSPWKLASFMNLPESISRCNAASNLCVSSSVREAKFFLQKISLLCIRNVFLKEKRTYFTLTSAAFPASHKLLLHKLVSLALTLVNPGQPYCYVLYFGLSTKSKIGQEEVNDKGEA